MEAFWDSVMPVIWILLGIVGILAVVLGGTAYLTYAERKVLGAIQLRKGPNVVGPFGLLQPMADGVKVLFKETIIPRKANMVLFLAAPIFTFFLALSSWAVIPFDKGLVLADINVGILYLLAISSLGVYAIIIAGWASNAKYPFLGGLRAAAQMISYEVSIGLILVTVLLKAGSLNLSAIVEAQQGGWNVFSILLPMFFLFFACALAETNRSPFDLPEGESELVGGFNTEYSAMIFAMFFLGEYANMILMSAMTSILFLGGWLPPLAALSFIPGFIWFAFKIAACLFVFLWVRGTLPRYRYDQLMRVGWKFFLPIALVWVVVVATVDMLGGAA
ncbi:MAG: NADH-quinone oxidoreductase subunit NuoH [Proteobacteria bacterium]|jgi:NADH-quinone oxidoreductase subunit H|nr:NADH-quinone oxidoreductase subunit NuoH [Alphaproteobacteria bacterium]NCC02917.1 NADH-quinone oxidoreductase subunit NuoH [Pseudomonadota bacterium]